MLSLIHISRWHGTGETWTPSTATSAIPSITCGVNPPKMCIRDRLSGEAGLAGEVDHGVDALFLVVDGVGQTALAPLVDGIEMCIRDRIAAFWQNVAN